MASLSNVHACHVAWNGSKLFAIEAWRVSSGPFILEFTSRPLGPVC